MSGRKVVVVDERQIPGGGASTEEILLPAFKIDTCSTGHALIMSNPVIADDELGLFADQGLNYVVPDPVGHVHFPDGEHLTMWLDAERTKDEIGRFSRKDASSYSNLLREWNSVGKAFSALNGVVGSAPSIDEVLSGLPNGNVWLRRKALSAVDVIKYEFEDRHVQSFLLWQAFQTLVYLDQPGTGSLAYSIVASRQKLSWPMPRGGSGELTNAIVRVIEAYGGTILTNRKVVQLIIENGRCTGFETDDGERFIGREAVVSTIHVKHLIDMAPASAWDEAFRYGVETLDPGIPCFVHYICTTEPPRFTSNGGSQTAVSAGYAGWPEDIVKMLRTIRDGDPIDTVPWSLVGTPTLSDATRAPDGHHTVKIITPQSVRPPYGEADWEDAKEKYAAQLVAAVQQAAPNMVDGSILAQLSRSPVDIERANPHMINGTFHGGDRGIPFTGALRPAPGWAKHRTPIPGLYQTGGTTHPGGSITGAPGRNAASVILEDLGTTLADVVASRSAVTKRA